MAILLNLVKSYAHTGGNYVTCLVLKFSKINHSCVSHKILLVRRFPYLGSAHRVFILYVLRNCFYLYSCLLQVFSYKFHLTIFRGQLLLLLSAFPIRDGHSGFSFSSCFYQLYLPPSLQPQPCPLSPHP